MVVEASTLGNSISPSLTSFQDIICTTCSIDTDCGGGNYYCKEFSYNGNTIQVCTINECTTNAECNQGEYCWKQHCCDDLTIEYDISSSICVTDVCNNASTTINIPSSTSMAGNVATSFTTTPNAINNQNTTNYYDSYVCGTDNVTYSSELDLLCHDTCIFHYGDCSSTNYHYYSTYYAIFNHTSNTTNSNPNTILEQISNYFHHYLYYSIGVIVLAFLCLCGFLICCVRCCCRRSSGSGYTQQVNNRYSYAV